MQLNFRAKTQEKGFTMLEAEVVVEGLTFRRREVVNDQLLRAAGRAHFKRHLFINLMVSVFDEHLSDTPWS